MYFSRVFEVLLSHAHEWNEKLFQCAFLPEPRSFERGCHDSAELKIFIPQVDELEDLDCH